MKKLFLILVLITCFLGQITAQKEQKITPPSLDDDEIPVVTENLPVPEDGESFSVRFFSGVTDGEESRIAIKNLGYILRPAMVQVFTKKGEEVDVRIVKKNWEDIQREGSSINGQFSSTFRTALEFGIIISAAEKGIPFIVSVSAGRELFPSGNLFVDIGAKKNTSYGQDSRASEQTNITASENETSNALMYVIIGLLTLIIGLLLYFIIRKNKGTLTILIILLYFSTAEAGAVQALGSGIMRVLRDPGTLKIGRGIIENGIKSYSKLYGKNANWDQFDLLDDDDADFMPDLDPAGQPSLPSSCLSTARSSEKPTEPSAKQETSSEDDTGITSNPQNQSDLGTRSGTQVVRSSTFEANAEPSKNDNPFTGESTASSSPRMPKYDGNGHLLNPGDFPDAPQKIDLNPFTGESTSGTSPRMPKYDEDGQLLDSGDFPDAPQKYDPNWNPNPENPFTGESTEGSSPRMPKYDGNGHLLDPGDFPDAPQKIDLNPFTGESTSGTSPRIPKYDSKGNLEDPGDFPDAPKQIDPERVNDTEYIMEQVNANIRDKGQPKPPQTTEDPHWDLPQKQQGEKKDRRQTGNKPKASEKESKKGCRCLAKAYDNLHERRYSLEKLLKIGQHTKKVTDFAISFGDNVSGVHAVSGIAWQEERRGILKSIESFDKTYVAKHGELIAKLYDVLLEIDHCEKLLGEENWYSKYGFVYYEFMKIRYASYK